MTPKSREDFESEGGGFLDGMEGKILTASFGEAPEEYQNQMSGDATPIGLTLEIESPDLDRPANQYFSIGTDATWDIVDGGRGVQNKKKPDVHGFNPKCRTWDLVEAMFLAVGEGDKAKGQDFFIARDHFMTEAAFYEDLTFMWGSQQKDTVGGEKKSTMVVPDEFVSDSGKTTAPAVQAASDKGSGGDAPDLDKIVVGLAEGKTKRELKRDCLKNETLKGNDTYMKEIVSGNKLDELEAAGELVTNEGKYV